MQDSPAIVCYLRWACLFCETTTGGISYTDCGSCLMSGNCAKDIRLATSCSSVSRVGPLMCVSAREANPPRRPHCASRGGRPQWIFTNRDRSRFERPSGPLGGIKGRCGTVYEQERAHCVTVTCLAIHPNCLESY